MYLSGKDVSEDIRHHEISGMASQVAALPQVRAFLLDFQRRQAQEHDVVMDGRDIGTVVLPQANVKIFLTASVEQRALRRFRELEAKGETVSLAVLQEEIARRDHDDSHRAAAPLRQAPDAVLLDTSQLDLEESLEALLTIVRKRGCPCDTL